ncbi:MAG: GTP-binding protein, partial [Pseudomonadota bacterium]|nr:GTP-binding protein [Pseudomonadota bacterium]
DMQYTAVIVNEFGEVGIDHLLVKATTEDIMMLEGGCLCCAVRSDLVTTLETLLTKRREQAIPAFTQVLIETSGLADPAPILRTLIEDRFVQKHYRLGIVVTTVDAFYGGQQLDDYDESVKQAALANQLVLTKIDWVDSTALRQLKQRLSRFNPSAPIHELNLSQDTLEAHVLFKTDYYDETSQQLDIERWLQAPAYLNQSAASEPIDSHQHDAYINSFCIEYDQPLHWLTLERWLQQLTRLRGKDLLRIKGIAYTYETDLPVVIQGVQHILQPPTTLEAWPTQQRQTQIVFITRNIKKPVLEQVLGALIASRTPADVCAAALILLGQHDAS